MMSGKKKARLAAATTTSNNLAAGRHEGTVGHRRSGGSLTPKGMERP
jgi:hypothetical protein